MCMSTFSSNEKLSHTTLVYCTNARTFRSIDANVLLDSAKSLNPCSVVLFPCG